jgi:hypothetical protein
VSLYARQELCAVFDPRHHPDQVEQVDTAHNPALFIRLIWGIHLTDVRFARYI